MQPLPIRLPSRLWYVLCGHTLDNATKRDIIKLKQTTTLKKARILMKSKKLLALLLAVLMLVPAMTACGGGENTETAPAAGETAPDETEQTETELRDDLPDGLKFTGETFTILSREDLQWENEMVTPELTGDIVNDAIYNREITVEERLDVAIDAFKTPGIWGNENAFFDKIRTAVQAGDSSYQLVAGYAYFVTALATEGIFTNLLGVNYLNFDQPWWNSNLREELTLYDQLYFAGGDLSYTMISSMFGIFLNKDLQEKYAVEDLYAVVEEGRWTYDYLYSLAASISNDLDGSGTMDENDEYGLVIPRGNACDTFFAAYDQPLTAKDENGNIVLRMGDAKAIEVAERMMSFYNKTNPGVFAEEEKSQEDKTWFKPFKEGRALLNVTTINYAVEELREVDFEYGMLPMAKYDEAQEKYQTLSQDAYSLFCVPLNAGDLDMIGAVTEAMAYESWKTVTPAYFEVAMKSKYSRDEASSRMLDLIRDGAMFNFGFVNSSSCNNMMHIMRNVAAGNQGYATVFAAGEKSYQTALDKLVQAYKDMQP